MLRRGLDQLPDLELERPLPLGYARPEHRAALADALRRTLDDVAAAVTHVDVEAVARAEQHRARTRRAPLPTGQLRSILELGDMDAATVVIQRPDHPAAITAEPAEDGRLVLDLFDRRVHLPPVARPALERLLTGAPTRVGDLPELDASSQLVLPRRLVREGLIVIRPTLSEGVSQT